MYKKFLSAFIMLLMGITGSLAQSAHADMYFEDAEAAPGSLANLSIKVENTENAIAGFSCKVELPDGFTVEKASRGSRLMTMNANDEYNTTFQSQLQTDGSYMLLAYGGVPFVGTDGEVAVLTISVPDDAAYGDYEVTLRDIETSVGSSIMQTRTEYVGTLTVGLPSYEDGYSLETVPFVMDEDGDYEMALVMNNRDVVKSIEFDMILPEGLYIDGEDGEYFVDLGSRVTSSTVISQFAGTVEENPDGSFHVLAKFKRSTSSYVFTGNFGEALVFPLFADGLEVGLHEVEFTNVVLNGDLKVAPYRASFVVGNPSLTGVVTLYGNYAEDMSLIDYVAGNAGVTSIDLSNTVALDNTSEVQTANRNAILYLADGQSVANASNVVVGNTCHNLLISDAYSFAVPTGFVTERATFERNILNDGGKYSFIVPFDIPALQAKELGSFYVYDRAENGKLYFDDIEKTGDDMVKANTAYFFQPIKDITSITVENTGIVATNAVDAISPVEDGLYGTYRQINVPEGAYGYIENNSVSTFVKAGVGNLINPFRAYMWLSSNQHLSKAIAVFGDDEEVDVIDMLKNDGTMPENPAYNLRGQRVSTLQKGEIYIQNNNKIIKK